MTDPGSNWRELWIEGLGAGSRGDLPGGCGGCSGRRGGLIQAYPVLEADPMQDGGDELWGVDAAPTFLGALDQLEGHRQPRFA